MPYNPQTKLNTNWCQQILAKYIKEEEISQNSIESQEFQQNENIQIAEGKWEDNQNLKFIIFIDYHSKIFASKQKRKSQKIFKTLSSYIGNRTPAQCRSHYQKVMIKHKTIAKLKKHYKELFTDDVYNKHFEEFIQQWKQIHPSQYVPKSQDKLKNLIQTGIQTQPLPQIDPMMQQMFMMWQMQQWNMPFFSCSYNLWQQDKQLQ